MRAQKRSRLPSLVLSPLSTEGPVENVVLTNIKYRVTQYRVTQECMYKDAGGHVNYNIFYYLQFNHIPARFFSKIDCTFMCSLE